MAIKIDYKKFRIFVILLIILGTIFYLNTDSFKYRQAFKQAPSLLPFSGVDVKETALYSKQGTSFDDAVTWEQYENRECQPIALQYYTVNCKQGESSPTQTNTVKIINEADTEVIMEEIPLFNNWFERNTDFYSENYFSQSPSGAFIDSISLGDEDKRDKFVVIFNGVTGEQMCYKQRITGWFTVTEEDTCSGKTRLSYQQPYKIVSNVPDAFVRVNTKSAWLYYWDPDTGEIRLPETEHCWYGTWKTLVDSVRARQSVVEYPDEIVVLGPDGEVLDSQVIAEINNPGYIEETTGSTPSIEKPDVFNDAPPSLIESESITFMYTIQQGYSWRRPYAYVEKAYIIPGADNYGGYLGVCRYASKQVVGFEKENVNDNLCYFQPNPGINLVDKDDIPSGEVFCCGTADCPKGVSSSGQTYACNEDHWCELGAEPRDRCDTDDECIPDPLNIWTDEIGRDWYTTGKCVYDNDVGYSKCKFTDTEVACNPSLSYPDGRCCKDLGFGLELLEEEECQPITKQPCENVGTNACCLNTQTLYTEKLCSPSLQCCGADDDGIGLCKETCEIVEPNLWEEFLLGIMDFLGTNSKTIAWIVAIILIIVALVFIGKAVLPLLKIPGTRGPPGYGGSGGGSGGDTFVQFK